MIVIHPHFSIIYHSNEQRKQIEEFVRKVDSSDPFLKFKTSGSTGPPKLIEHSKKAISVSAYKTIDFFQLKEKSTAALCLSVEHIAGAMMLIRSMIAGLTLHVFPTTTRSVDFIQNEINFIALVPMQLEHALKTIKSNGGIKLCRQILIGGAPISPLTNEKLKEEKISVYHSYGMTETITHVALKKTGHKGFDQYDTLEGISLSCEDDALCISYPEITDQKIKTNDRVELINSNSFRWLGRLDHCVNSGGLKISPEILEKKIALGFTGTFIISGIQDDNLGQKLVMIIEQERGSNIKVSKELIGKLVDKYEIPKAYCIIDEFTWTENNKINRIDTLKKAIHRGWKKLS